MCVTGSGSSLVFDFVDDTLDGTASPGNGLIASLEYASLGAVDFAVETLEAPRISDAKGTVRRQCPGDDITVGDFTSQFYFDPSIDIKRFLSKEATIVRTHQEANGKTYQWTGTGYIKAMQIPEEAPSQLAVGTMTVFWRGDDLSLQEAP